MFRFRMRVVIPLVVLMVLGLLVPPSHAVLVFYLSRAAFNAAAPGLPIEDFEEANVAPGTVVGMDGDLDKNTSNAFFAPGEILDGLRLREAPPEASRGIAITGAGFAGVPSIATFANFFVDTYNMFFYNNDTTAVGVDLHSIFDPSTLEISIFGLGDVLLGMTRSPATPGGVFWGVSSDDIITRINLSSLTDQAEGVDNVAFGMPQEVPEASALLLLGSGLLAAFGASRRRFVVA